MKGDAVTGTGSEQTGARVRRPSWGLRGDRAVPRRAFSLAELLVALAIVGVMAALLLPSLAGVYGTAQSMQCQANLRAVWDAYNLWRSEHEGRLLTSGSWTGRLLPYVDYSVEVFQCPSGPAPTYGLRDEDGAGHSRSGDGSAGTRGEATSQGDPYVAPDPIDACLELRLYRNMGSASDRSDPAADGRTRSGGFLYGIPLDARPWVRRTQVGDRVLYEVRNAGLMERSGGEASEGEVRLSIRYGTDGQPRGIRMLEPTDTRSATDSYVADLLVSGEIFIANCRANAGRDQALVARNLGEGAAAGYSVWRDPKTRAYRTRRQPILVLGDYALSRGSYERGDGSRVHHWDPNAILLLDFGARRSVADFNMGGASEDVWDRYFFSDVGQWEADFPVCAAKGWQAYQANRHAGKANALFCDGSVRSMTIEELYYGSPVWYCQGR